MRHLRVDVSLDQFAAITQLVYVQFGGIAAKFEHSGVAHDWSTGSTGCGSMKAPPTYRSTRRLRPHECVRMAGQIQRMAL